MNTHDEADLVALLQGELEPERAAQLRQAIDDDPALRAEFEAYQMTLGAMRKAPTVEPSPDFVQQVRERIRQTPIPIGPASRRLEDLTERRRAHRPFRPLYVGIALAAAASALLAFNLWVIHNEQMDAQVPQVSLQQEKLQWRRRNYAERRDAPQQVASLQDGSIDAGLLIGDAAPRQVVLVGQQVDRSDESCIMAFTPDQWEAYQDLNSLTHFEANRRSRQRDRAQTVDVVAGRVRIPPEMLTSFVGGSANLGGQVTVLAMAGRSEIWAPKRFSDYLRTTPTLLLSVPTDQDASLAWYDPRQA